MLYWECKHRLKELRDFRQLVGLYFSNTGIDTRGRRHENANAATVRAQINLQMAEVVRSCSLIGHSLTLTYTSPSHGFTSPMNVITNLFSLDRLRIPASKATDSLDMAIGDYERLKARLRRLSWNPLYWLRLGFFALLGLPFRMLEALGFDTRSVEQSFGGKLFKAIGALVFFLAALLQTLSLLGLPTSIRHVFGLLRSR